MVVVKIELWPKGQKDKARTLGVVTIANDGTGDTRKGNYNAVLSHSGKYFDKEGIWRTGRVERHSRNLSPYHLVFEVLKSALRK